MNRSFLDPFRPKAAGQHAPIKVLRASVTQDRTYRCRSGAKFGAPRYTKLTHPLAERGLSRQKPAQQPTFQGEFSNVHHCRSRYRQDPQDACRRRQELCVLLDSRGGSRRAGPVRTASRRAEGGVGKHAAVRRRQDGIGGRYPGILGLGGAGREEPARDRLSPGARPVAGLHRGSGGGRSGGDARCDPFAGRRRGEDQPAEPRRSCHRPFGDDRRIRKCPRIPDERGPRIRAEHGALYLSEMGTERVQQFPRGAAGHRHLPPGEP